MKKFILYFSFFVLHSSLSWAQDTLFFINGDKKVVNVISVGPEEVIYSVPPSDEQISIGRRHIDYIKYHDGYKFDNKYTSRVKPFFMVSGGKSVPMPVFQGYGGNYFNTDPEEFGYSGFASDGTIYSVLGGIKSKSGLGITGKFSVYQHGFDAQGFMTQLVYMYINNYAQINGNSINIPKATATGTYHYNNYSGMIGIEKDWEATGFLAFGLNFSGGELVTNMPAIQGIAEVQEYYSPTYYTNYYLNINSEQMKSFIFEMGSHIDITLLHHFIIRGSANLQFSAITNKGGYQLVDMTNGSTFYYGSIYADGNHPIGLFIGLAEVSVGLGYEF
jgi:hypothetical protein